MLPAQGTFPTQGTAESLSAATDRSAGPASAAAAPAKRLPWAARFSDYLILAKPRIAVMVLLTVALGYGLAASGRAWNGQLLLTLLGVGLTAVASGALNQWWERKTDGLMWRTAKRPLPMGRLTALEACLFGLVTGVAGLVILYTQVNELTAFLAAMTLLLYTWVYTPLKRLSSLATIIGAIPGAMPPVLGWTGASGELGIGAVVLFGILFLWQFPHFLAIGWMYREEYEGAGLHMLPAARGRGGMVGCLAVVYALALIPVSLQPVTCGLAGGGYAAAALLLGLAYLWASIRFWREESRLKARQLLLTSVAYLPLLWLALLLDHWRLASLAG